MKGRQFALTTMGADRWPLYARRLLAAAILLGAMGAAGFCLAQRGQAAEARPSDCRELLVNGGFEALTLAPWEGSSAAGFSLLTDFTAHSGDQSAWLGGYQNASDFLTQTVTLPARVITATLQLWVQIDTQEPDNAAALDLLTLEVRDMAGALLSTAATLSNQDHNASWSLRVYNLPLYPQQTVRLVLHAVGDAGQNSTDFHVDDVSLAVCAANQPRFIPWLGR